MHVHPVTLEPTKVGRFVYRMGEKRDVDKIWQLQKDVHEENTDFFLPNDFHPENCAITLLDDKLVCVSGVDIEGDVFNNLAEICRVSPELSGELWAVAHKNFRKSGFACLVYQPRYRVP